MSFVLVVGMHRSGTSMLMHLLVQMGYFAGYSDNLLPPHPKDNAKGYWENIAGVRLNEEILEVMGGTWRCIPSLVDGWENHDTFKSYIPRMKELFAQYEQTHIAFKDPRTSITLPLWRKAYPSAKIICCIRHPIEVMLSLQTGAIDRDLLFDEAVQLWETYYDSILHSVDRDSVLWVNYQTFFHCPNEELQRIADYVGIQLDETAINEMLLLIDDSQKHYALPHQLIYGDYPSAKVSQRYHDLCDLCGAGFQAFLADGDKQHHILKQSLHINYHTQPDPIVALKGKLSSAEKQIEHLTESSEILHQQLEVETQKTKDLTQQLKILNVAYYRAKHYEGLRGVFQSMRDRIPLCLKLFKRYWIILQSGQFDEKYYLEQYADVRQAGINPIWHYVRYGVTLGYNPNAEFDTNSHIDAHPEIVENSMNPFIHYLQMLI